MSTNRFKITIGKNEKGEQYFMHDICGRKSYHPEDIKHKYCAVCHTFPEDEEKRASLMRGQRR